MAPVLPPARVRVPPGTQSGQKFRLRERGIASMRDGRRGDLVVEVRVVLPALLDERSKELLREFGRINSDDVRKGLDADLGFELNGADIYGMKFGPSPIVLRDRSLSLRCNVTTSDSASSSAFETA